MDLVKQLEDKKKEREELKRNIQSYLNKDMNIDLMASSQVLEFAMEQEPVDRDNFLIFWKDYAFIRGQIAILEQAIAEIKMQRQEILDKIDELEFTNIVRMNSNLGANTTQDRIKEYIKQQLNQPKKEDKDVLGVGSRM